MRMFDIEQRLVNVDVRPSKYPLKGIYRSKLQTKTADYLCEIFPNDTILEDFIIPGSRLSVDFFVLGKRLVIEVDGRQHNEIVPFFHGQPTENKFAKQIGRDRKKEEWCELNNFTMIRIQNEEDLCLIQS